MLRKLRNLNLNFVLFLQEIDFEGFKTFMASYLEMDPPIDLITHLFLSFIKRSNNSRVASHGEIRLFRNRLRSNTVDQVTEAFHDVHLHFFR